MAAGAPAPAGRPVALTLALAALLPCALALATYGALRLSFGERPAFVHVRWAPAVDTAARRQLEQQYHLTDGRLDEGRTFVYSLTDLSRDNIAALVLDARAEDTHQIHRTAYRIWRRAPRGPYAGRGALWGPVLETVVAVFAGITLFVLGLAALHVTAPATLATRLAAPTRLVLHPARTAGAIAEAIRRLSPPGSARAVAAFRILFGSALLAIVITNPVPAVLPWLLFWGVAFVAGAAARVSFVMLAAGMLAWAAQVTTGNGHHPVSALLLALIGLSLSHWGDTWSVDAWLARRRGASPPARDAREYGYTYWIPGAVLGVAFAAAALAKLRDSGLVWITNGTVKYHFLTDAANAPFDWGVQVGRYPALAVALSFSAILVEGTLILFACAHAYRARAAAGLAAAGLLLGFYAFQGLFWPGWWILLLSFLPWHLITDATRTVPVPAPVGRALVTRLQPVMVILLLLQQVVVSGLEIELEPALSTYDMYSTTYPDAEAYETHLGFSYWLVAPSGRQCRIDEAAAERVRRIVDAPAALRGDPAVRGCVGDTVGGLRLERRRPRVDWARWTLLEPTREALGVAPLTSSAAPRHEESLDRR